MIVSLNSLLKRYHFADVALFHKGCDIIPPHSLKNYAEVLCRPLSIIYNKYLQLSVYPGKWKIEHITPIHKSDYVEDIANYRPISILSRAGKILESLIQSISYSQV